MNNMNAITNILKYLSIAIVVAVAGCSKDKYQFDASGNFETDEVIVSAEANGKLMKFVLEEGQRLRAGQQIGYVDSITTYYQKRQMEEEIIATLAKQPEITPQLQVIKEQLNKAEFEQQRTARLVAEDATRTKDIDDWNAQVALLKKQYIAEASTLNTTTKSIRSEINPIGFQIKLLEDQLHKCKIINPIDGVVLTKYALQDEMTMNGKPLYKVANLDTMTLRAYVTDDQLSLIKLDQIVKVFVDKGAKNYSEYNGIIRWISDKSEFTPKTIQTKDERANLVWATKITVKNDGYLKIGMYADIKFK